MERTEPCDFSQRIKSAVASLAARPSRKRAIEEELSSHDAAAFTEELERTGDRATQGARRGRSTPMIPAPPPTSAPD